MIAAGAFSGEFEIRAELIRGQIVAKTKLKPPECHVHTVLTEWSYEVVPRESIAMHPVGAVRIPVSDSEPEPDLLWVKKGDYLMQHPEPHEVLLLVEIADASLADDRGVKLGVHAEAGLADYWIVNVIDLQIEVYRNAKGREFLDKSIVRGDTLLSPLALPSATLQPSRLFG
jgi:Uma2 family endonuclease